MVSWTFPATSQTRTITATFIDYLMITGPTTKTVFNVSTFPLEIPANHKLQVITATGLKFI
jgi:hypothetical protein